MNKDKLSANIVRWLAKEILKKLYSRKPFICFGKWNIGIAAVTDATAHTRNMNHHAPTNLLSSTSTALLWSEIEVIRMYLAMTMKTIDVESLRIYKLQNKYIYNICLIIFF